MQNAVFVCLTVFAACAYKFAYAETCSQLLASDKVADGDKLKAQLCQIMGLAETANDLTGTLQESLSAILAEHGVNFDGDSLAGELEKRKNDFLRFGKRKHEYLRFGKRKHEYLRFG